MVVGQETKTYEDINVKATAFLPIHTETALERFKPGTLSFILKLYIRRHILPRRA